MYRCQSKTAENLKWCCKWFHATEGHKNFNKFKLMHYSIFLLPSIQQFCCEIRYFTPLCSWYPAFHLHIQLHRLVLSWVTQLFCRGIWWWEGLDGSMDGDCQAGLSSLPDPSWKTPPPRHTRPGHCCLVLGPAACACKRKWKAGLKWCC